MMVSKFGISLCQSIFRCEPLLSGRVGPGKLTFWNPNYGALVQMIFFCSFRVDFLGSLAVDFQGFIHELCSLLEWNWIMGGIFFKSLSPRICSGKPREFFLRGNHGLGWNITLIWKETLILEIHPLSIEPMIVGGRVLRNSKVDGTVPTYWLIRTRFKPTFWYLCHLFWP